ncbi:ribonuclease J [Halomonas halocynthiae]|uniref:ribonuclease J n=1 Tax=Halomonas halocynthiae TaxID=176290 RepID=UPI00048285FB|nr:ribonuclease J [Halomonas halocynthiae]
MNLNLYGYDDHWLALDCGMMIRQDLPDSPLQVPDLSTLETLGIRPAALVITHGHEDHIGAAAWLWPKWGCPIYATPLAAGLLRAKFAERGLSPQAIHVIEPGEALDLGPFALRYLPMTHSIPESCALLLSAGGYRILHTGDWKLDPEPLIEPAVDPQLYQALAPLDLVVGDSTNALQPGHSRSEGVVAQALMSAIGRCKGRVIVSCFASNLARILAISQAAEKSGRRVSLMGRSMERMVSVARGLGYLDDMPPLVPTRDLGYLPPEEVLVIATGSQGEPRAALSRLAQGRHPHMELTSGDSVIFSSRAIPGNERLIERVKRGLSSLGVNLMDDIQHPELHASGHPAQEELTTLYGWVCPKQLIPVHGEPRHQQAHQQLAKKMGIDVPIIPRNGDLICLDHQGLTLEARHPQTPRIIRQDEVAALAGLEGEGAQRHGELFIALTISASGDGWIRIGQLLTDGSLTSPLDESAFADWIDQCLEEIHTDTLAELRHALTPRLLYWLNQHLRRMPSVHLQLLASETKAPPNS